MKRSPLQQPLGEELAVTSFLLVSLSPCLLVCRQGVGGIKYVFS